MYNKSILLLIALVACPFGIARAQGIEKVENVQSPPSDMIAQVSQKQKNKEKLLKTNQCPDCDLSGEDLSGLNLKNAFLPRANLQEANLIGTDLRGAFLQDAKMCGAELISADLRGANLNFANLTNANLTYAKLSTRVHPIPPSENEQYRNYTKTKLLGTNLEGARLNDAELEQAFSPYANFNSARLRRSNLSKIDLRDAKIQEANLSGVFHPSGADLHDFSLLGDLGANLQEADLNGADLSGSDLRGANLRGAQNVNLLFYKKAPLTSRAILTDGDLDVDSDPRTPLSFVTGSPVSFETGCPPTSWLR